jgi:hypothetical protein
VLGTKVEKGNGHGFEWNAKGGNWNP